MPRRPHQFIQFNPIWDPVLVDETEELELFPLQGRTVTSTSPSSSSGNMDFSSVQWALLRFDLRGWEDSSVEIVKAILAWSQDTGTNGDIAEITIGRIADADADSWTSACTYATKDGVNEWASGSGGFRNAATEITWTPTPGPGVTTSGKFMAGSSSGGEGTFPYRHFYYPNTDDTFAEALADFLNEAKTAHSGYVNLYLHCATKGQDARRGIQFNVALGLLECIRLVLLSARKVVGTGYISLAHYPPFTGVSSQDPVSETLFADHMDMCSVSGTAGQEEWNGHKGISPSDNMQYAMTTTPAAGTSLRYVLLHFDLNPLGYSSFDEVKLRILGGHTTNSGGTTNVTMHVGQAAHPWAVGDGELTVGNPGTRGPTYSLQEKDGSAPWPGSITVGDASFLDTAGQAEQSDNVGNWTSLNGSFRDLFEFDITGMANRAMSEYDGHLWLRLRYTHDSGATGRTPAIIAGPTKYMKDNSNSAFIMSRVTNGGTVWTGYRGCPHLVVTTPAP